MSASPSERALPLTEVRFEPLQALHALSEVLSCAPSEEEIHAAALDALTTTIAPDRASLSLFDDDGVLRLRAERGSSHGGRGEQTFPLRYGKKRVGELALFFDRPRRLSREEVMFVESVAGLAAVAVERASCGEKEDLYRQIFERSADGIAILDHRSRYLEQNAAHAALLGFDDAELRGKTPAIHLGEEALAGILRAVEHEGHARGHVPSATRDGARIDLDFTAFAVRGSRPEATRYVGVTRNVSELRRALEARQELLSIASHELRTPVTALSLQIDGLLRAAARGELDGVSLGERLRSTRKQVVRLVGLIESLLDLSRIEARRLRVEREAVDVCALVREAAERFADAAARAGSKLTVHASGVLETFSDGQRIDQIVTNLVSNAVKYGAGEPIDVSVEEDAAAIRIAVRDRGIGIAPEDRARVFDRFERAVEPRRYAGFGLGLYIAREITRALGGTISLESALGVGSTFTLELPKIA